MLDPLGFSYPDGCRISVRDFPKDAREFAGPTLFRVPPGLVEEEWPPVQLLYVGVYVQVLQCETLVIEHHYIDRDFIEDASLFYSRSLRSYPNYCQRVHFFAAKFGQEEWRTYASSRGDERASRAAELQRAYLGYMVVRPLPIAPVGRTVLKTFGPETAKGQRRVFGAVRQYEVNLGGFQFVLEGLAFQQQDRAVSACATTALWSAVHKVAPMESLPAVSPGAITESASRYNLEIGRTFPSEGLTVQQVCEATRAAGLSPMLVESTDPEIDKAQLHAFLASGFAPVLALSPVGSSEGHAVCAVGVRLGEVLPRASGSPSFRDASSAVNAVYLHDDRLGPYASAPIFPFTVAVSGGPPAVRTAVEIRWPDGTTVEQSLLMAMVVPVPVKLRLSVSRMRALGTLLIEAVADMLEGACGDLIFACRYVKGSRYRSDASATKLSETGLYTLVCETVLSRYVGLIELSSADGAVLDVLVDATEAGGNPAVLAVVLRTQLDAKKVAKLSALVRTYGAKLLS